MTYTNDFVVENGVLVKYVGDGGEVVIPDTVVEIGNECFESNDKIKHVIISEGITTICSYAFLGCDNLEQVTVPKSLKEIGSGAFCGCRSLKNIEALSDDIIIGTGAFTNCESMKNDDGFVVINDILYGYFGDDKEVIEVPHGVLCINNIISYNDIVEKIVIPDGVIRIEKTPFANCSNLHTVVIPDSVETISEGDLFLYNPNIENIIASDHIYNIIWELLENKTKKKVAKACLKSNLISTDVCEYINKKAREFIEEICEEDDADMMKNFIGMKEKVTLRNVNGYMEKAKGAKKVTEYLIEYKNNNFQ